MGPRTVIKKGTIVENSYIMGNDFYNPPVRNTSRMPEELHVGENCVIRKAILDNNVFLGNDVQLINQKNLSDYDGGNIYIRDGIIIVPRGACLPSGFVL